MDPRDQSWEIDRPTYLYFHDSGGAPDEYELDVADVSEAMKWAEATRGGRTFVVYACVPRGGLVHIAHQVVGDVPAHVSILAPNRQRGQSDRALRSDASMNVVPDQSSVPAIGTRCSPGRPGCSHIDSIGSKRPESLDFVSNLAHVTRGRKMVTPVLGHETAGSAQSAYVGLRGGITGLKDPS